MHKLVWRICNCSVKSFCLFFLNLKKRKSKNYSWGSFCLLFFFSFCTLYQHLLFFFFHLFNIFPIHWVEIVHDPTWWVSISPSPRMSNRFNILRVSILIVPMFLQESRLLSDASIIRNMAFRLGSNPQLRMAVTNSEPKSYTTRASDDAGERDGQGEGLCDCFWH